MTLINKYIFIFILISSLVKSQTPSMAVDTVPIDIATAEDLFLKNNYSLLAQKFNVNAEKSLVRQSGLLNNPNFYYENSVYNRYSKKYFPTKLGTPGDAATQGEYIIQVNWLFSIAGKRNKAVKVAKAQADIAQFEFDDLIRTLLFSLRADFYQIHYNLNSLRLFDDEISSLKNIVGGFETQYQKGNISLREVTRIRALIFSLQNDRLSLVTELYQVQNEFSTLLNNVKSIWYKPILNESDITGKYPLSKVVLSDLLGQALENRPDLKVVQAEVTSAKANVSLQKAIGVPDITIQGVIDRNGSYIPNYQALAIGVPLVIFNRNQGNIASAKFSTDASTQLLMEKQISVQNDVFSTYQKILETEKLNSSVDKNFSSDFNSLIQNAQSMFEKKNLSLLEFVDLFESYKESMIQYNNVKAERYKAFEELIFNVGKDVFKP